MKALKPCPRLKGLQLNSEPTSHLFHRQAALVPELNSLCQHIPPGSLQWNRVETHMCLRQTLLAHLSELDDHTCIWQMAAIHNVLSMFESKEPVTSSKTTVSPATPCCV